MEATMKQKYIWNTLGGMSSALMSIGLLIFVNRILGGDKGGEFSFAYSHAQLMYSIAAFEVRPMQSTDIKERYSFSSYHSFRLVTCFIMTIIATIYALLWGKDITVLLIVLSLYKMTEAYADVFGGYFQQKDRIDYSGKALALRTFGASAGFVIILFWTRNINIAVAFMLVFSGICLLTYDYRIWRKMTDEKVVFSTQKLVGLIKDTIPLFFSTFALMYLNNAPKYAINRYCSYEIQNKYNILFMPAFVINMMAIFVFRPMLTSMAEKWNEGRKKELVQDIKKILLIIVMLTGICLLGATILGLPILSMVYTVNLDGCLGILLLIMVYGGLNATVIFLTYLLTIMQKQRHLLLGYGLGLISAAVFSPIAVKFGGMLGASIAVNLSIFVIVLDLVLVSLYGLKHFPKKRSAKCR